MDPVDPDPQHWFPELGRGEDELEGGEQVGAGGEQGDHRQPPLLGTKPEQVDGQHSCQGGRIRQSLTGKTVKKAVKVK